WHKAIQHFRDDGKLTESPKDIGPLIQEVLRDIEEEELENIKEELWRLFKKPIQRIVVAGFPEWYKQQLMEKTNVD
ncbi:MAG: hypothetical protein IH950_12255, partial [Bacteroidetes bacterium]|nr:hypothetical protein [Bacteroidota bacterium]